MERVKGPSGGQAGWLGLELRMPRPGEPLAADHVSCPEARPPYPRSWVDHVSSIQTHGHRWWSLHDSWKDSRRLGPTLKLLVTLETTAHMNQL